MPAPLAHLRLAVGRLVCGQGRRTASASDYVTVPVTVQAGTSDGAELRLHLEVKAEAGGLDLYELDRLICALVIPATRRWARQHDLAGLSGLGPALDEVAAGVREGLAEVGTTLLGIELMAAEHLLAADSANRDHGSQ